MSATVYSVTHRASGREYIGMTGRRAETRWLEHNADARNKARTYLHNAMRKHGADAFVFKVEAELPTLNEAKIAEMIAIAIRKPAFNLTSGGDGTPGRVVSQEHREAARQRLLNASPALRAKMSAPRRGRPMSAETKAKLSLAKTGKPLTEAQRVAYAKRRGVKASPETRAKMSASHKARFSK